MNETSRRKFLAVSGVGAAGVVVGVPNGAASAEQPRKVNAATEPVVAYVDNPKAGVVHLMVGEREIVVEDHDLVARILNAAGGQ